MFDWFFIKPKPEEKSAQVSKEKDEKDKKPIPYHNPRVPWVVQFHLVRSIFRGGW